jgi:hypothetical protein
MARPFRASFFFCFETQGAAGKAGSALGWYGGAPLGLLELPFSGAKLMGHPTSLEFRHF